METTWFDLKMFYFLQSMKDEGNVFSREGRIDTLQVRKCQVRTKIEFSNVQQIDLERERPTWSHVSNKRKSFQKYGLNSLIQI